MTRPTLLHGIYGAGDTSSEFRHKAFKMGLQMRSTAHKQSRQQAEDTPLQRTAWAAEMTMVHPVRCRLGEHVHIGRQNVILFAQGNFEGQVCYCLVTPVLLHPACYVRSFR